MNCKYVRDNLVDLVEGHLEAGIVAEFRGHCAICDRCRVRLAAFERVWKQWGEAQRVKDDEFFITRLEARIEDVSRQPFVGWLEAGVRLLKGGFVAAGLVGCVYTGVFLASDKSSTAVVAQAETELFDEVYYNVIAGAPQGSVAELYLELSSTGGRSEH